MLTAADVVCCRGDLALFPPVSFTLNAGELMQITGRNGAGKTTLLRALAGLTRPDEGSLCWQGKPLTAVREQYHQQMLWFGHLPGVSRLLSADENLRCFFPRSTPATRAEALEAVGLLEYDTLPLMHLSAGQQRRAALARLWLTTATLWILDEPLSALDQMAVEIVTHRLEEHIRQGGCALLTTHQPLRSLACPLRTLELVVKEERDAVAAV